MNPIKAVALLSGGLDSTLALKIVSDIGIDLWALNFVTPFCTCTPKESDCLLSKKVAQTLGIQLKVMNGGKEYLEVVRSPKFGYGRNMNPCLDCRIFMFKKAKAYMAEIGAYFIVTGEVLGERPMSQRMEALRIIERESGLEGFILRPLSARLLPETIPEKEGFVPRDRLLDIRGRSRKPQMELAQDLGILDYPCPAGGCLLTDPIFAKKMKDLISHVPDLTLRDVYLLKTGRHFRLSPHIKVVVGRNEKENETLHSLGEEGDFLFKTLDDPGPIALVRVMNGESVPFELIGSIIARYSKRKDKEKILVGIERLPYEDQKRIFVPPIAEDRLANMRI